MITLGNDKLKLGTFFISGGSASQYIESSLGSQGVGVHTWNNDKEIAKGGIIAEHIVESWNNFELMLDIVKQVAFWFGNEVIYPPGSNGYNLAQEAKQILDNLKSIV